MPSTLGTLSLYIRYHVFQRLASVLVARSSLADVMTDIGAVQLQGVIKAALDVQNIPGHRS